MQSIKNATQIFSIVLMAVLFGAYGCGSDLPEELDENGPTENATPGSNNNASNPNNEQGNLPDGTQANGQEPNGSPGAGSTNMPGGPDGTPMQPGQETEPADNSNGMQAPEDNQDGQACLLDGTAAVKIVAQVSWPASIAMEAGNGTFEIWFKADITDDGIQTSASGHVCEVNVPDFRTNVLAGNDTHGTVIPTEAWANGPRTALSVVLSGREAGSTLRVEPTPMFLGTELDNPMGEWPNSSTSMRNVDHDGDGYPGVTSYAAMGAGYSNPRVDILNPALRANRIFLGMRNIIGFDGMLTSCDRAAGAADLSLDQRSFGCLTPDGTECNAQQTSLLDSNMPQFEVESATFTLQKLAGAPTCENVRATLP